MPEMEPNMPDNARFSLARQAYFAHETQYADQQSQLTDVLLPLLQYRRIFYPGLFLMPINIPRCTIIMC